MMSISEAGAASRTSAQSNSEADLDTSLFQLPIRHRQPQVTDISTKRGHEESAISDLDNTDLQESWHALRPTDRALAKCPRLDSPQPENQLRLTELAFERLGHGDTEQLPAFLDAGALIEHVNTDGLTLLVMAIKNSDVATTKLLLEKGADPHHRANGKPPLFHAVQNQDHGPVLIRLLLDNGANFDTVCGIQPAGTGHLTIVKLILAHDADLADRGELSGNAMGFAASMGHLDIVKLCMEEGLSVDNCDDKGVTALMSACELGHVAVVEYLLKEGADVDKPDARQCTPALEAASKGNVEILQALINEGADLRFANDKGQNALDIAMSKGYTDVVHVILTTLGGPDYVLESVSLEIASARRIETIRSLLKSASLMHEHIVPLTQTPRNYAWVSWVLDTGGELVRPQAMSNMILIAIADADAGLVEALLSIGADPDEFSLSTAVVNQNIDIVRLLLDNGVTHTPSARCIKSPGDLPTNILLDALLNMSCQGDTCLKILQLLLNSGRFNVLAGNCSSQTAFWRAMIADDWAPGIQDRVAYMMLDSVKDINFACENDGGTLMHHVVRHGRKDMVSYLLEKGAHLNARDNEGRTPFILGCEYQAWMIPFLLERGANPSLLYDDGRGPLHAAATVGNIGALEQLLAQESIARDLNRGSRDGWTPVACALAADQEEAALFLTRCGATLDYNVAVNGRTMLHLAAAFGHERVFEQIMSLPHTNVNARDAIQYSTPLLLACAGTRYKPGSTRIVSALLAAGADIEAASSHLD
ncbi:hypothetical protein OPT61_g2586 [Boeremia exigua]|uniref:Uncharacterized protein n=1 Tax=Boeremia exigua TaxID=749465 RepID=A0ACC2IL58_9PLEO|nr:hypothetical protein OPT61_g2586 [Boeremia exigua]